MDHVKGNSSSKTSGSCSDQEMDLKRGPWTVEEDLALIGYIANHGQGRWNSLALLAGLKRTGKSCRLRWLNYLRPDVRRGNITLEEQIVILELHSRWGNRWSKIAQRLPGRTDNEIKNYWRTRVQKHAKQLKCDVNSKQFKDTMRYLWMPCLLHQIQQHNMVTPVSDLTDYCIPATHSHNPNPDNYFQTPAGGNLNPETLTTPPSAQGLDMDQSNLDRWINDNIWNIDDDFLFLDQQFNCTKNI